MDNETDCSLTDVCSTFLDRLISIYINNTIRICISQPQKSTSRSTLLSRYILHGGLSFLPSLDPLPRNPPETKDAEETRRRKNRSWRFERIKPFSRAPYPTRGQVDLCRRSVKMSSSPGRSMTKEYPSALPPHPSLHATLPSPFQLRDKGLLRYRLHPPRRDRLLGRPIKYRGYVLRGTSSTLHGSFRSVRYFVNVERVPYTGEQPSQTPPRDFVAIRFRTERNNSTTRKR